MGSPTREQVRDHVAGSAVGHGLTARQVEDVTDAVLALLVVHDQDHRVPASIVERINDGWDYVKPAATGTKRVWFRMQDGANNWVLPPGASDLQREPMTEAEQLAIYGTVVAVDSEADR